MNLIIVLLVLLLLFGGGGFYFGGPVIGGSGIGLAMTYRILQLHHGSIEVQSKAGRGTEFQLRIPLSATDWGRRHLQPVGVEIQKGLAG